MRALLFIFSIFLVNLQSYAEPETKVEAGPGIDTNLTCSLVAAWNDKGSRADLDGFFYLPYVGDAEFIIGGYGTQDRKLTPTDCVVTAQNSDYLVSPIGWELIWKDKGSGARQDGSMWRAIPPGDDYRCVGHVPQEGYEEPALPKYRCIHISLTEKVVTSDLIWSDKGSGSRKKVTMFRLPNSASFVAVEGRLAQLEVYDLKTDKTFNGAKSTVQTEIQDLELSRPPEVADEISDSSGDTDKKLQKLSESNMPSEQVSDLNSDNEKSGKSAGEDSGINQPVDVLQTLVNDMISIPGGTSEIRDFLGPEKVAGGEQNQETNVWRDGGQIKIDLTGILLDALLGEQDESNDGEEQENVVSSYTVTVQPFKLGKYEVTFAQWDACVADGGCSNYRPTDNGWGRDNHPVTGISWDDVQEFIAWFNAKTSGSYRLPTDAEWDYAARAGSITRYAWGNKIGRNLATCENCGSRWDNKKPAPIGSFPANSFGLYDMHGNVWEWTEDCAGNMPGFDVIRETHRDGSARTDGNCDWRLLRGGSWSTKIGFTHRLDGDRAERYGDVGFRLALADFAKLFETLAEEMVTLPGGEFKRGDLSGSGTINEKPVHTVAVKPFRLSKYEVTFALWDACVADGGCAEYRPDDSGWGRGNRPVINVSWDDTHNFIDWLNGKTGGNYRLPTESEWEYAARAGNATEYYWGDDIGMNQAVCIECGSQWDALQTAPVGSFPANGFGLHDMHGNVWEWTEDCWKDNYKQIPKDGSAWNPSIGQCPDFPGRVIRGGSWGDVKVDLRSAARRGRPRSSDISGVSFPDQGFRLAQDIK